MSHTRGIVIDVSLEKVDQPRFVAHVLRARADRALLVVTIHWS